MDVCASVPFDVPLIFNSNRGGTNWRHTVREKEQELIRTLSHWRPLKTLSAHRGNVQTTAQRLQRVNNGANAFFRESLTRLAAILE